MLAILKTKIKKRGQQMKKLLFLLGLLLCVMPKIVAQDKIVPSYRIGGHYFSKDLSMDEAFKISSSIMALADNEGNRVINLLVDDGFKVPESIKKYEIPFEKVKNAEQLEEGARNFQKMNKLINSTGVAMFEVGKALPDEFSETDLNGKTWTKDDLKGHVTVVNVWYSGCGPCRKEMPVLSTWKNKYPDVLFISANFEEADKVKRITEKAGFNWTHIVDDTYFTKRVGKQGYPLTIVVDKDGIVRYCKNGTNDNIRSEILQVIDRSFASLLPSSAACLSKN